MRNRFTKNVNLDIMVQKKLSTNAAGGIKIIILIFLELGSIGEA